MKKVAIITDMQNSLSDAIMHSLKDFAIVDCQNSADFNSDKYDLIINISSIKECPFNVLTSHRSLLPSFDTDTPVKDAFLAGVKVTGITIFYTKPRKILAQYPVFIYNDAHYDELENELMYIEQALLPVVAAKIIKNEPFEVQSLMNGGNCGGCKGCRK